MEKVIESEKKLGRLPRDVSADKLGYDIESATGDDGRLIFIEVKGRVKAAATVTISKNEILTALNKPDTFILALVEVEAGVAQVPVYVRQPFMREPDFSVTSVNYSLNELAAKGTDPE